MITIEKPVMDEKAENAEKSERVKTAEFDFPIFRNVEIIPGTFHRKEIYDNGGR